MFYFARRQKVVLSALLLLCGVALLTWNPYAQAAAPGLPVFTAPFPASPANSDSAIIHFARIAADTTAVECSLDDGAYLPCSNWSGTGSTTGYHILTGLSEGEHVLAVRQTNPDGQATSAILWTVDLTNPDAPSLDSKPSDPVNSSGAEFGFSGEPGASFQCKLDAAGWESCTSTKSYTGLSEGSHTFQVRQTDTAGNTGSASSYTWTVDLTNPDAPSLEANTGNPTNSTEPSFGFSGEPGASFQCKLDSAGWESCTSTKSYTGLSEGSHTFQVRQTDTAGNTGSASSYTWTVDLTNPDAPSLDSKPADPVNSTDAEFGFSGEPGASFQCKLDSGGWEACTSTKSYTGLSEGSHTFQVRQTDTAGNTGSAASYTWTVDLTNPDAPSLDSKPADPSNDSDPSFGFSGEPGASFQCKLDSGGWEACTSTKSYTGLSEGSHTFQVRQTDTAGNTGSASSYTWTVDLTNPDAPSLDSKPADPSSSTTPSFDFSGEPGAVFMCSMDDANSANASVCTSPYLSGVLLEGPHTFRVWQIDQAGNQSSTPQSYTWEVDLTNPDAPSLDSKPADPSNDAEPSFGFSGESGASFQCKLDAAGWEACTSTKSYTGLSEGSHTFSVRQTDQAGNTGSAASYTWTVDLTNPDAPSLDSKPADPSNDSDPSFGFSGEPGASFQCKLDAAGWEACTSTKSYTGLSEGSHTFQVRQTDTAGNTGSASSYTWTVDLTNPDAPSLDSKPADPVNSSDAEFGFSGEPGASFQCKLDSGGWEACTSPKSYTGLSEDSHTFSVRQTDQAGNTGSASSYTWTVDLTSPDAPSLDSKPVDPTNSTSATFNFSGESGASFQCKLDAGSWEGCSSPTDYVGLLDEGPHTFRVRQTDQAGNTGVDQSYTWEVDLIDPAAPSLDSKPADPSSDTSPSFGFSGEPGASFQCKLDSAGWEACTSPKSYTGLSEGSHTFLVRQTDQAGNTGSYESYTWELDLTNPDAPSLDSKPSSPINSTDAEFAFSGESGASFQCKLDSEAWEACTSTKSYTGLSEGSHTFRVRQTDQAGNTGIDWSYAWTIDLTSPDAPSLDSKPADPSYDANPSFEFSGESGASFQCKLDSGGWEGCSSPKNYTGLLSGSYTFQVRQTDQAGNTGSSESYTWTIDLTSPDAPALDSKPADPSNDASPSFGFSGDTGNTFQCKLDSAGWEACISPKSYTGLSEGSHTFSVRQIKPPGITGTEQSYNWTVDLTNPDAPSLDSKPANPTNDSSPSFGFSGEAGASFQCKLDAAGWEACTSTKSYTGLSEGSHTFSVRQTDTSGNTGLPGSYTWDVDLTPPLAPVLLITPPNPDSNTTPSFSFSGEAGASFLCSIDDANPANASPCTSPYITPALTEEAHAFRVWQVDQAGNQSTLYKSYSWQVDLTAPVAPVLSSKPADPSNDASPSFSFSGEAGASFQCKLDSGAWGACSSPKSYSSLAGGSHSFSVRQTDAGGSISPVQSYSWVVDLGDPSLDVSLMTPVSSPSNSQAASISYNASDAETAVSETQCRLDDASWESCSASPVGLSGLSEGSHAYTVKATDAAGNNTSKSVSWQVDLTAPAAPSISIKPDALTQETSAELAFSGEAGASFQCKLDTGSWGTCASPKSYTGLSEGSHTFQVRQIDSAGNTGSSGSYTWQVDLTSPESPNIASKPSDPSNNETPSFTFSGESGASFLCSVDEADFANAEACTSPHTLSSLSEGSHTFRVWQVDQAGNQGNTAASYTWQVDLTAPAAPVLSNKPAAIINSTSVAISFSGESGASFLCSIDGNSYQSCTSPRSLSGLSEESHSLAVRAVDQAGNQSLPASTSWTVDLTPPPPPGAYLQYTGTTSSTTQKVTWTETEGVSYRCSLDSAPMTSCVSPRNISALANGDHSYKVRAQDQAGNITEETLEWTIDQTVPDLTVILSAPASTPTKSTSATITYTPGSSVVSSKCSLDEASPADCQGSPVQLTGLSAGDHTYTITVYDSQGRQSSQTVEWTVDLTPPPVAEITQQPDVLNNQTRPEFSFSGTTGNTFVCSVDKSDPLDALPCSSPYKTPTLAEGSHTFRVWQVDQAGNASSTPDSFTWELDLTPPSVPLITNIPDTTQYINVMAKFSGDEGAGFQCRLDGAAEFTDCTSPKIYLGLAVGSHQISVRSVDQAGNISSPVSKNWTILPPPAASPTPPTPTKSVNAYRMKGRWYFMLGERFRPGDIARPSSYLMTVQISESTTRPLDTQAIPRIPTYGQGIISWSSLGSRASRRQPRWVRVGDRVGHWTGWVPITWLR